MILSMAELTWPEVAEAVATGATTLILPLGATEQHGPHLPLGTDTYRAEALAERLASIMPNALVAPTLPVGCSDEHQGFAGLLGLERETLAGVIVDCARRATKWGVQQLVVVSAHGGNADALELAAGRLERELPHLRVALLGAGTALSDAILAVAAADGIPAVAVGLHAGEGETSEMLALRPDLVRMHRATAGCRDGLKDIMPRLRRDGLRSVTSTGILGDATAACADRGHRYLAAEIQAYRDVLRQGPAASEGPSR
ncbi:MAG: mycofactocin biosynthesis peptidyl-dipeptidase MftE [Rhodospirillales bacterium]|nr:MAG: mycofactocin biosynthesis peptidyl-dipeptidase MftE [Rhodospirillales bacterium]